MSPSRTRGHRAGLDRDRVLTAALDLADRKGIAALTMRRLAAELDVEAMTIYHHVPNKEALLDGLVERVVAEAARRPDPTAGRQQILRDHAIALRDTLLAHPAVVPLLASRPATTPANNAVIEGLLERLCDNEFTPARGLRTIHALTSVVVGQVTVLIAADNDSGDITGVDARRYPLLAAALRDGTTSPTERFDHIIDAVTAGL